jgi:NUMOD3 motif
MSQDKRQLTINEILERERAQARYRDLTDGQINIAVGNYNKAQDPEWLEKQRNRSEEWCENISRALTGRMTGELNPFWGKSHDLETRARIAAKKIGKPAPNRGVAHSQESLEKMRKPRSAEARANMRVPRKKMLTCPHCNRTGAAGNMARYHMDNCPHR